MPSSAGIAILLWARDRKQQKLDPRYIYEIGMATFIF